MAYLHADVVGYLETGEVEVDVLVGCEDGRPELVRLAVWPDVLLSADDVVEVRDASA